MNLTDKKVIITSQWVSMGAIAAMFFTVFFVSGCSCLVGGNTGSQDRRPRQTDTRSQETRRKPAPTPTPRETDFAQKEYYTVVSGDTLAGISSRYYGTTSYWRHIAKVNGITNPRNLQVGQRLKIPDSSELPDIPLRTARKSRKSVRKTGSRSEQSQSREKPEQSQEKKPETRDEFEESLFDLDTGQDSEDNREETKTTMDKSSEDVAEEKQSEPLTEEDLFALDDEETTSEDDAKTDSEEDIQHDETEKESETPKFIGVVKTKSSAPLMSRPSALDSSELERIPSGQNLEYSEFTRGYYKVIYNEQAGYIHNRYVTEVEQ